MIKLILLFTSILSLSLSTYRPMSSRTIDFGDNICYYKEYNYYYSSNSFIEYVKPCPEGKYCESTEGSNNYQLHSCETLPKYRNTLNADCSTDFECDTGLKCSGSKCVINVIYKVSDSITGSVYYCEDTNKLPLRKILPSPSETSMSCISPPGSTQKSTFENKYYVTLEDGTAYLIGLEPYKVPGIINLKQNSGTKDYDINYIESSYIGKVEVGQFVQDERACESGIALYFYGNGELTEPSDITTATVNMYKRCVNLKEVLSDDMIVYSLSDGKEKIYNKNELPSGYNLDFSFKSLTKLEMFKNYKEKLHSILEQCINDYDYTEPYTCKNNELRKWWYFYSKPEEYMLYKDHKQVIDYLVQDKYYDYYQDESNGLRALKYMFYLLILLSL